MATCKGCGKTITYHDEGGQWVPYNHPEGGRHHCDAYQKAKQDQDQSQKAPGTNATGVQQATPPASTQSTSPPSEKPPTAQESGQERGRVYREKLIVLQSSLKAATDLYCCANHPKEDYDQVVEKVLAKAIEITGKLIEEATA